jgi:hypothetical protein
LAAAHFLLTGGVVGSDGDAIEFVTMSGLILTARQLVKVGKRACDGAAYAAHRGGFCVELDFPVGAVEECVSGEVPPMPDTLNGVSVINICKTSTIGNLMVVRRNLFFCFQQSLQ